MATLILNPETPDTQLVSLDKPSILIGSAADADVQLESESVAEHHARIELKPDGCYIISLNPAGGIYVNGDEVSFQRIRHGDKIEIGGIKAVLLSEEDEPAHEEPIVHEEPVREAMPLAFSQTHGLATRPQTPSQCPQCGLPLSPGMPSCPQCGLPLSNLPAMPLGYIPPVPPGQSGPGILPIIAFLAALTVVGAPVALVLGLMSLSAIRKHGGTVRDRALAKWSIGLGLVWLMLGAVAVGGIIQKARKQKMLDSVEVHESKVIRALKNLACAQKYAQTIEAFDADGDGQGEYGALAGLAETKSPFFDADLADGEAYGYRFTVREASEGQFLAVAEPIHYGETGLRTFVINPSGQIRGADTSGERFGQVQSVLPVLQGERSAYYEIDDEIAQDVLNYVKSLSSSLADQEKTQRILKRLRENYALTSVGRELDGMEASTDRFVTEQRAVAIYQEARTALKENKKDVALATLQELKDQYPAFSKIAAVERELFDLRSEIAQEREQEAQDLFTKAEKLEREAGNPQDVQQLYQRIEKLYPDTDVATRVAGLKPELQRQMRERNAEDIFSDLMELSPESDYEEILNRANQLRRNYSDTSLFAKVEKDLSEKERKARASSWRVKTKENMAAGRMRGALAQLESAARENPDLLYDLRDLFITLYRSGADTLMKEGDARKALTYYERLNQLLRMDGSQEQISPDRLAQLHRDVGLADFGKQDYETARWHLASAAWKYQDDAPFNTKLGAANMYLGLYKPAQTALNHALELQPNLSSALLYKSYMNLRTVLTMEQTLAESFREDEAASDAENNENTDSKENSGSEPAIVIDMAGYDGETDATELGDAIRNATASSDVTVNGPKKLNLKPASANNDWFSSFTENQTDENSAVPAPKDLDLFLGFDYAASSSILPNFMQFLEGLQQQRAENKAAKMQAVDQTAQSERSTMRGAAHSRRQANVQKTMTEYRAQLRELTKTHFEDVASRKELYARMDDMKQRLRTAENDITAAAELQPQILSLTQNLLSQIDEKYKLLDDAGRLISSSMEKEIDMREDILTLAEKILATDQISSSQEADLNRTFSRLKKKLFDEETLVNIDQALRALRESMGVNMELGNMLRAAEKNT